MTEPRPDDDVVVADPRDGQVIDLDVNPSITTAYLCGLAVELKRRERDLAQMHAAVERELIRRLADRNRTTDTVGDYQLKLKAPAPQRVWDVDELDGVVNHLVHTGYLTASEKGDLFRTERTVVGTFARRLLLQLTGPPREALEDCYEWQTKGKPHVVIELAEPSR